MDKNIREVLLDVLRNDNFGFAIAKRLDKKIKSLGYELYDITHVRHDNSFSFVVSMEVEKDSRIEGCDFRVITDWDFDNYTVYDTKMLNDDKPFNSYGQFSNEQIVSEVLFGTDNGFYKALEQAVESCITKTYAENEAA